MVETACIICRAGSIKWSSIHLSISSPPRFAAEHHVGRKYRSTVAGDGSTALVSKCGQCRVDNQVMRLNTDLFQLHISRHTVAFNALTLLLGRQKEHLAVKIERSSVDVIFCLKQGADCLYMVQPVPIPSHNPVITYLIRIKKGFTFPVVASPGCRGKVAVKWVYWSITVHFKSQS